MADVFLSYKRDDRPAVEQIAAALRRLNLSVWFDASLSSGEAFSDEIDRELQSSKAILVCWSPSALLSRWVKVEALTGFENNKLAACQIGGDGSLQLPVPFNSTHAEDLRSWLAHPTETLPAWKNVLRKIGRLCDRPDLEAWGNLSHSPTSGELTNWISAHYHSPLFTTADALLKTRRDLDAEEATAKREANLRRLDAEAIELAIKRVEDQKRASEEAERKRREIRKERWLNSFVNLALGTVVAIPVFFVVYAVVAVAAYFGIQLVQWLHMDRFANGVTRMAELFGAGASGYWGVQVARNAIGAILKAWSGWPTYALLVSAWAYAFYKLSTTTDLSASWWLLVLGGVHAAFALGLGFFWIARKQDAS